MDPLFLLQQWSLHGRSTYLFRHRITSDTRSEVFANHVTTVAIPTADKGSLQLNVFWVSKGYAARNNSAPQFQCKKLFWRRAVSELLSRSGKKTNSRDPCFMFAGHQTHRTVFTYDMKLARKHCKHEAKVIIEPREVSNSRWTELQFPVHSPLRRRGFVRRVSNYPGSRLRAFKFLRVSH
jgi:hypothetical protein